MKQMDEMETGKKTDTVASVLAEMATYGPFLPGSVRPTTQKGRPRKDGTRKTYPAPPIYTWTDPGTGKQKCKRIPLEAFAKVRELTRRYAGAKRLIRRLLEAARREGLEAATKKTPDVGVRPAHWASRGSVGPGAGTRQRHGAP